MEDLDQAPLLPPPGRPPRQGHPRPAKPRSQRVLKKLTLTPGGTFLLSPADFHEIVACPGQFLSCYNVVIEPSALEEQLQELLPVCVERPVWLVDDFHEAEADFRRLWKESQHPQPGTAALMHAVLRCILIELARRCIAAPSDHHRERAVGIDSALSRAVLFLDHHFREPLTLADVAAQAHLSPNYFSEKFREFTGTSFQAYLQQRRLRFARSLLASTDLGVTEVSHAAGFNSLSHFGRVYRRRYGHAPSAHRGLQGAGAYGPGGGRLVHAGS